MSSDQRMTDISTYLQKQQENICKMLEIINVEMRKLKSEEDQLEYLISQRLFPCGDEEWKLL